MPLIKSKSKEAFHQNLKAEISAGKPMKQSLAIAYATKKAASKKYADGGEVKPVQPAPQQVAPVDKKKANDFIKGFNGGMAHGGEVGMFNDGDKGSEDFDDDFLTSETAHDDYLREPGGFEDHGGMSDDDHMHMAGEYKGRHFAKGGMMDHHAIVHAIMSGKQKSGPALEDQADGEESHIEDPEMKKKKILHSIMESLHERHKGG